MWILVISLFSTAFVPGSSSNGSINVKYSSHAECMKAKEQAMTTIRIDNYRANAGCVYIKN